MMTVVLFSCMVALFALKHQKNDSPQSKQHAHMYSSSQLLLVAELCRMTAKAVILFAKQMNSIITKNGYSLFIASIVILFLRIGEQIAKLPFFCSSIRFERSRIDEQGVLFAPSKTNALKSGS